MNKEIELKFGIKKCPNIEEYKNIEAYKILQTYVYSDKFSAIRTRKISDINASKSKYIYTVKTKGDIESKNSVYEIEKDITKEEYDKINNQCSNIVEKCRIKIFIDNNLIVELDLYYGKLEGLITVEVEFPNETKLSNFCKPDWFGIELDKKCFSNANLSKMTKDEFIKLIGNENIENNIKIKNEIEKRILKI